MRVYERLAREGHAEVPSSRNAFLFQPAFLYITKLNLRSKESPIIPGDEVSFSWSILFATFLRGRQSSKQEPVDLKSVTKAVYATK